MIALHGSLGILVARQGCFPFSADEYRKEEAFVSMKKEAEDKSTPRIPGECS